MNLMIAIGLCDIVYVIVSHKNICLIPKSTFGRSYVAHESSRQWEILSESRVLFSKPNAICNYQDPCYRMSKPD